VLETVTVSGGTSTIFDRGTDEAIDEAADDIVGLVDLAVTAALSRTGGPGAGTVADPAVVSAATGAGGVRGINS